MQIRDEAAWKRWQDSNPPPSWGPDPNTWPTEDPPVLSPGEDIASADEDDAMGDAYGYTVLVYAQRWADEMESRFEADVALEDCADETSHDANRSLGRWGVTGFQHGAAVQVLADCWKYGEELRRWHNLSTQIGDEGERANQSGGVLNPAVMNVDTG